ncbi:ABC transporter ATP-binding protein [Leisingera sp. McT4-56]|uniref:ABC transporter ATP-binding protein n=1 Tax=Leisingera sp. McT4-56 TaxID=2881255 RepID=UPI001CF82A63|nr:ABC transporter ATP-binding protein [Leisingera sp. McT4-56]MCB4458317.1 ABC transporter ATP-binding protein [Leisingera sp. McT4-56]
MPEFHTLAHDAAAALGFSYDSTAPAWLHPMMHLVLVLAPALLASTLAVQAALLLRRRFQAPAADPAAQEQAAGIWASLPRYILRATGRQQAALVVLSLTAMPILYLTLELPKQIVNRVFESQDGAGPVLGFDLPQVSLLFLLCGAYLAAISLNGLNKYWLNIRKGRVAESFVRRLRLAVYRQWRRDQHAHRQPAIMPVLGPEVEPVGGFASELLTVPLLQGGTLATILLFMFVQDPILAAAALTVLPLQLIIVPRLQRRVNAISRKRIREMRLLSGHLDRQMRAARPGALPVARSFRQLQEHRLQIHRLKFLAKAIHNFLTALTPFLFYSLGGYFVLQERVSLGALVAMLSAHKEFSSPLKDLFRFYQQSEDVRIRYQEICAFAFRPGGLPGAASGAGRHPYQPAPRAAFQPLNKRKQTS